jgi:hypothetical protein
MKKYRISFAKIGFNTGLPYYNIERYKGTLYGIEQWELINHTSMRKQQAEEVLDEILSTEKEVICLSPTIKEIVFK